MTETESEQLLARARADGYTRAWVMHVRYTPLYVVALDPDIKFGLMFDVEEYERFRQEEAYHARRDAPAG